MSDTTYEAMLIAECLTPQDAGGAELLARAARVQSYLNQRLPVAAWGQPGDTALHYRIQNLTIRDSRRGAVPFLLWEPQRMVLDALTQSRRVVINTARQMGITSLLAAYALTAAITEPGLTTLVLSTRQSSEIAEAIYGLAPQMRGIVRASRHGYNFENGSSIIVRAFQADAARGMAVGRLIIDNAAYVHQGEAEEFWYNIHPAMQFGGQIVVASTPAEPRGFYHDLWTGSDDNWTRLALPFHLHPERDEVWAHWMRRRGNLTEKQFSNEFENCFRF